MSDDFEVDGAHEGVLPIQAFRFILGTEMLAPGDRHSLIELEELIRTTPLPAAEENLLNPPEGDVTDDAFNSGTLCLANIYLTLVENGMPIESGGIYSEEEVIAYVEEAHPDWINSPTDETPDWRSMIGEAKALDYELFTAAMEQYPFAREHMGGITPFMMGYSYNAVRAIKGLEPVENPGLMMIEVDTNA